MIHRAEEIIYPEQPGEWRVEQHLNPTVDFLRDKLPAMDRHYRPIIYLFKNESEDHLEVMEIQGGDGLFFIEVADQGGFWFTTVNPTGDNVPLDIWTSDQGNTVLRKYLWDSNDVLSLAEYFINTGKLSPDHQWIAVKSMELSE